MLYISLKACELNSRTIIDLIYEVSVYIYLSLKAYNFNVDLVCYKCIPNRSFKAIMIAML